MSPLAFFDCNCMIGIRAKRDSREVFNLNEFKREFEHCGIMGAVLYHAVAKEYSCDYGNRRLMREIGDDPQLVPQWVLLPHHTQEMPPAPELVAEMLSLGVRTARIFPSSHGFGTSEYILGPLLSELERHRIPLFIDQGEVSDAQLVALCHAHPLLPVVVCGFTYASDWRLMPLCEQCPNLHVETSLLQGHNAYRRFVPRFGADRLLFGSGLPFRSPGATTMMTRYEDILDEARPMIAGGNMLQLLANVVGAQGRPLPELSTPPAHLDDDPILACVREGKPLSDEFIIDSHGHLAHFGAMGAIGIPMPAQDADEAIVTMDRIGIDMMAFSMWSGLVDGDPEANDLAINAVAKYPDRLMAYGCYNNNYPDMYEAELERVFRGGKVIGIKPYGQYNRARIDDPRRAASWEWANEAGAIVLGCGSFNEEQQMSPAIAMKLAERYPNAKWMISHVTSSHAFARATIEACNAYPNIYAEVCYSLLTYGIMEMLYEQIPLEQILYGSDMLMRDPASQIGYVAFARIPYEAKQRIFGHNFADMLRLSQEARTPRV